MKVLVTGASGFVGLNIMTSLELHGYEPIGVVRHLPVMNTTTNGPINREFRLCDLRDIEGLQRLVQEIKPTYIVHAGAMTPSDDVERTFPLAILDANERSTLGLLQTGATIGVERFIFLSSAGVYLPRPDSNVPLTEQSDLNVSGGMYALTKIASERLCGWAGRTYDMDVRIVRLGPVYGIHETPTGSRTRMSVVHRAMALARAGETIRCNDPNAVYDLIFGVDAANAIVELLGNPRLSSTIFNLAGPNISVRELVETVASIIDTTRFDWVNDDNTNLQIPSSYRRAPLDTHRLQEETGFVSQYGLERGLGAYHSWLDQTGN